MGRPRGPSFLMILTCRERIPRRELARRRMGISKEACELRPGSDPSQCSNGGARPRTPRPGELAPDGEDWGCLQEPTRRVFLIRRWRCGSYKPDCRRIRYALSCSPRQSQAGVEVKLSISYPSGIGCPAQITMIESCANSAVRARHEPGHASELPVAVITIPSGGTFPAQMVGPAAIDSTGGSARRTRSELNNFAGLNISSSYRSCGAIGGGNKRVRSFIALPFGLQRLTH